MREDSIRPARGYYLTQVDPTSNPLECPSYESALDGSGPAIMDSPYGRDSMLAPRLASYWRAASLGAVGQRTALS